MSGILGVWNLDGRPVDRSLLLRLGQPLSHRGPDGYKLWINGSIGFGCQMFRVVPESATEVQPYVNKSGVATVFDGRLDNREELLERLGRNCNLSLDSPDVDFIPAAYREFGDRFPEYLNGDFALALFDPLKHRLVLAKDAIGIRPLYYCRAGSVFIFASGINAILAHPLVPKRPNDDMVAEHLLNGWGFNPRGLTFFEEIFSLTQAQMAVLNPESFSIRRYWDFDLKDSIRFRTIEEYAEALQSYFFQAVRRRARSAQPVAVSVSGGLDSSSIFCAAKKLSGREPIGISLAGRPDTLADEEKYVAAIEEMDGVSIHRIPMVKPSVLDGGRKDSYYAEAPCSSWTLTTDLRQLASRKGARLLLSGYMGDQVIIDLAYLADLFFSLSWRKMRREFREFCLHWNYPDRAVPAFRMEVLKIIARASVPQKWLPWMRRVRQKLAPDSRYALWYSEALVKRARALAWKNAEYFLPQGSVSLRWLYHEVTTAPQLQKIESDFKTGSGDGVETAYPFMDRDLLSFLMRVPGDIKTFKGVPRGLFRESMRGVLPESIRLRGTKGDIYALVIETVERELPAIMQLVKTEGMASKFGYLDVTTVSKKIEQVKHRMYEADCVVLRSLFYLPALEAWLENFFGEQEVSEYAAGF